MTDDHPFRRWSEDMAEPHGVREASTATGGERPRMPPGAQPVTPTSAPTVTIVVGLAAVVAGFVALAACLVLLGWLAEAIRENRQFPVDGLASTFLHGLASPGADAVMGAATFVASDVLLVPLVVLSIAVLAWRERPGPALFLLVVAVGSVLLNEAMKSFFHRPRPDLPWAQVLPEYGFPSGHTMNGAATFLGIAVIVWSIRGRRWGILAVAIAGALACLVGTSRVYLGVHFLTDVLGGLLAAASWLLLVVTVFRARLIARSVRVGWSRLERDGSPPDGGQP
jgi:undecaprenyl-diphosphatase